MKRFLPFFLVLSLLIPTFPVFGDFGPRFGGASFLVMILVLIMVFLMSSVSGEKKIEKGRLFIESITIPYGSAIKRTIIVLLVLVTWAAPYSWDLPLVLLWTGWGFYRGVRMFRARRYAKERTYHYKSLSMAGIVLLSSTILIAGPYSYYYAKSLPYGMDDKRLFDYARVNIDILRSVLSSSVIESGNARYPHGDFGYNKMRKLLPDAGLPERQKDAYYWIENTLSYRSGNGESFTMTVQVNNRFQDLILGTPQGVSPEYYPH